MSYKTILDQQQLNLVIDRLCQQLLENHSSFEETLLIGLQPRGIYLAQRIHDSLENLLNKKVPLGELDITFHRDDFRRRDIPLRPNKTNIPFIIEDKSVVLVDDVLFTGRSVRSALDAMITFGRPKKVELLVLVDRKYARHLPIAPDYVGLPVNTIASQHVSANWREQGATNDLIWLSDKNEDPND